MDNQVYWCKNIGTILIKEMTFEIDKKPIQKHRTCQKCHKLFECDSNEEFQIIYRKLNNRIGNLTLCFDCDSKNQK